MPKSLSRPVVDLPLAGFAGVWTPEARAKGAGVGSARLPEEGARVVLCGTANGMFADVVGRRKLIPLRELRLLVEEVEQLEETELVEEVDVLRL